jgi:hypothetical protein
LLCFALLCYKALTPLYFSFFLASPYQDTAPQTVDVVLSNSGNGPLQLNSVALVGSALVTFTTGAAPTAQVIPPDGSLTVSCLLNNPASMLGDRETAALEVNSDSRDGLGTVPIVFERTAANAFLTVDNTSIDVTVPLNAVTVPVSIDLTATRNLNLLSVACVSVTNGVAGTHTLAFVNAGSNGRLIGGFRPGSSSVDMVLTNRYAAGTQEALGCEIAYHWSGTPPDTVSFVLQIDADAATPTPTPMPTPTPVPTPAVTATPLALDLTIGTTTSTSVQLTWLATALVNPTGVVQIEYRPVSGGAWRSANLVNSPPVTLTVSSLTAGTAYEFRGSASSSDGKQGKLR